MHELELVSVRTRRVNNNTVLRLKLGKHHMTNMGKVTSDTNLSSHLQCMLTSADRFNNYAGTNS